MYDYLNVYVCSYACICVNMFACSSPYCETVLVDVQNSGFSLILSVCECKRPRFSFSIQTCNSNTL